MPLLWQLVPLWQWLMQTRFSFFKASALLAVACKLAHTNSSIISSIVNSIPHEHLPKGSVVTLNEGMLQPLASWSILVPNVSRHIHAEGFK